MFGYTPRNDLRIALQIAFDDDHKHDTAHVEFERDGTSFSIQFVADESLFNVAGPVPDHVADGMVMTLDNTVVDWGSGYVVFEAEAAGPIQALDEVLVAAAVAGMDRSDITTTKSFRRALPSFVGEFKQLLGIGDAA